ncbi:unnamed protein product [Pleuronectes platessa]|uniref:Ubiquitin-like domain-containing protein n=1 Tax=Pleuronectes platessa TaxID=8262 RepID=A0A9N7V2Y5_PLEPL|nr:unnamed protein product [Pleuronectes platessa]
MTAIWWPHKKNNKPLTERGGGSCEGVEACDVINIRQTPDATLGRLANAAPQAGTMESSSDEEEVRTFVQGVSEKYSPDNFPFGQGLGVVVLSTPPGSPVKDRVFLPSILVLNSCGISKAGDKSDVAAFCAHVVELDLSHNQLNDWGRGKEGDICTIVSNTPHLDFLNLSMNPLSGAELEPSMAEIFFRVRQLVLINTNVSWDTVHTLTQHTPELEELFLCLNGYNTVSESRTSCPSLRLLQITDNQLQTWSEVRKFGPMYPCLTKLVLANNSVESVGDTQESLPRLFPNLRCINLNNSGLSEWEDIERLNFFPKLEEVKVMGIPLLQPYTTQERRSLVLAQLPSVVVLNGGSVSSGEREDAERFFIRFYQDCPKQELPESGSWSGARFSGKVPEVRDRRACMWVLWGCRTSSVSSEHTAIRFPFVASLTREIRALLGRSQPLGYHILVSKYGQLAPLAEVDLSPSCTVVDVRWGDRVEKVSLHLEQTVSDLRKHLRAVLQLPTSGIRLFYIKRELCSVLGQEELRWGSRALHSYRIQDGDEILVVPKVKSRCSSSD